ncbi:uncharacterized mitochondrial protein AtMg00310-like [Primulina huaijiensis]|uniref:uncharacterized mitochondrial protein AtMg00310-like n=1 Tax=Primulina huaijiensis TaxID=1492673 RepID=UPI003CC6F8D6
MSCFRIPQSICESIERECAKFWWRYDSRNRKLHWKKWDYLCKPKCQGGMGYMKPQIFNKSLLAKQIWRIVRNPHSLVTWVLKARYFKHVDVMSASMENNPSYIWRSLMWIRSMLDEGLCWRVGNGTSITIFQDKWVPKFRSHVVNHGAPELNQLTVSNLIKDGKWDDQKVGEIVLPYVADVVLSIPLPHIPQPDSMFWKYDAKGKFSVRE